MSRILLILLSLFLYRSVYSQNHSSQEITLTEADLLINTPLQQCKNYVVTKKGYTELKLEKKQIGKTIAHHFSKNTYKITILSEEDSVSSICWTENRGSYSAFLNEANALGYIAVTADGSVLKNTYTFKNVFVPSFQAINTNTFIVILGSSKKTN